MEEDPIRFWILMVCAAGYALLLLWGAVENHHYRKEKQRKRKQMIEDLRSGRRSWMSVGFTGLCDWD